MWGYQYQGMLSVVFKNGFKYALEIVFNRAVLAWIGILCLGEPSQKQKTKATLLSVLKRSQSPQSGSVERRFYTGDEC